MSPPSLEERVSSDCCDNLAITFDQSPDSLVTVDYSTHFIGQSVAWRNGDIKNYQTTFCLTGQTPKEPTNQELVVNIIGEVAHEGSKLGARGNAWLKPGQKINDKTSVKDVLILVQPTMATESLVVLYENQIHTVGGVEDNVRYAPHSKGMQCYICMSLHSSLIPHCRLSGSLIVFARQMRGWQLSSPCR